MGNRKNHIFRGVTFGAIATRSTFLSLITINYGSSRRK